jgi:hypothetical protein
MVRVIGHIFEDLPERTNTQWLVGRNGEVLFLASSNPSEPHVAAALSGDALAKLSKLLGQISSIEIAWDSHRVNNSCRT